MSISTDDYVFRRNKCINESISKSNIKERLFFIKSDTEYYFKKINSNFSTDDLVLPWTNLFFKDILLHESEFCFPDTKNVITLYFKVCFAEDEIDQEIISAKFNSEYCRVLMLIDLFFAEYYNPYRKQCNTCIEEIKINHYGDCYKCSFRKDNRKRYIKDYKVILDVLKKLKYNESFMKIMFSLYKDIPRNITTENIIDYFYKTIFARQEKIFGSILKIYMENNGIAFYGTQKK